MVSVLVNVGTDVDRILVGARGFEPPTSSSRTMRATKLRHAPTEGARLQGLRMIAQTGRSSETGDACQTY